MTQVTGRRTRLRPGREQEYAQVHAQIPAAVDEALRRSGVVGWRIWIDGSTLFHSIETDGSYAQFLERIRQLGPVDPHWDELIADLLDPDPSSDSLLQPVWVLDGSVQHPGATS